MFVFQLAVKLGRTVRELLKSIDSRELSEWQAYNSIDPFVEDRADRRQAISSRLLAVGLLKKQFCTTDEFLPIQRPPKEMSIKQMETILRGTAG